MTLVFLLLFSNIFLFNKYLSLAPYVTGMVLNYGDTILNKTNKAPGLMEVTF